MAFKNVYRTEEEQSRLLVADIPDPRTNRLKIGQCDKFWTYDEELGLALMEIGVLDREDYGKKMYVLFWGELDKEYMIKVLLEQGRWLEASREEDRKNGINRYQEWDLVSIDIPSKLVSEKKKIFEKFIEAMGVFGINGNPENKYKLRAVIHDKGGLINE
jgi:hypothetical protein